MTLAAAVVTTFGNDHWKSYAEQMLKSYAAFWPAEIPILVHLDDGGLESDVQKYLRKQDGLVLGWSKDHADFVQRNRSRDDNSNYRKQATRFCHKVFALKFAADTAVLSKKEGKTDIPRYLIWMDADVLTTRKVEIEDIVQCLPKEGDAVSYLGRKDWPHSECGWLAFDLDHGGQEIIDSMFDYYLKDEVFKLEEWHDSFVFDKVLGGLNRDIYGTNLTPNAVGMEVWPQSPMAAWSRHYKGPIAKAELAPSNSPPSTMRPMKVQTRNSIPDEAIQRNILENQAQIKNWVRECIKSDEEIIIVSAGPMFHPEDVRDEYEAGRKIVAVKHALEPLKKADIKPWACILLDPRDHMNKFVENPDKDIIWFVASQVTPKAVKTLLDHGCNVWGYHASVGANEEQYTMNQPDAVVSGGSATATRGLFVLEKLGFHKFKLYGYDLCVPDKPNLDEKDEYGQPKYFEVSLDAKMPNYHFKRAFWSKGELLAQYEEFKQILVTKNWEITAIGQGIAPFISNAKRISDLRTAAKKAKLCKQKPVTCEDLLCSNKIPFLARLRRWRR